MSGKRILVFGAHPDDIEFGCGAFLLDAAASGAHLDLVVFSKGEAGTHGDPVTREAEARKAAEMLGASIHFPETPGDTRIRANQEMTLMAATLIREMKPDIVMTPTGYLNQHPDHRETSLIVRDANRLARYGKTPGLEEQAPHATELLLFYDISSEGANYEGMCPLLVDVSGQLDAWKRLMACHESQVSNRNYIDLQVSRAKAQGLKMGVQAAMKLFTEGPSLVSGFSGLEALRSQRL